MNKLFMLVGALLLTTANMASSYAAILNGPYIPEIDSRFDSLERLGGIPQGLIGNYAPSLSGATSALAAPANGGATGYVSPLIAKSVFNPGNGGVAAGTYRTSPYFYAAVPANSIIRQGWVYVNQAVVGAATVAIQCNSANDLFSAADFSGNATGARVSLVPTGTAATMVKVGSTGCLNPAVVIGASNSFFSGVLEIYLEYVPFQ